MCKVLECQSHGSQCNSFGYTQPVHLTKQSFVWYLLYLHKCFWFVLCVCKWLTWHGCCLPDAYSWASLFLEGGGKHISRIVNAMDHRGQYNNVHMCGTISSCISTLWTGRELLEMDQCCLIEHSLKKLIIAELIFEISWSAWSLSILLKMQLKNP